MPYPSIRFYYALTACPRQAFTTLQSPLPHPLSALEVRASPAPHAFKGEGVSESSGSLPLGPPVGLITSRDARALSSLTR